MVVVGFIFLLYLIVSNATLARKLKALEKKYDGQFKVVFEAIYSLMDTSKNNKSRKIGFKR